MTQTLRCRAGRWSAVFLLAGTSAMFAVPRTSRAEQFVLFDVTFSYTKEDADNSKPSKSHYYVRDKQLNPDRPKDWTAPVDYRNGTVHIRTEVIDKPVGSEPTTWSLCYIPNKGQKNGYGCTGTAVYRENGVYEQDVSMKSFWENDSIVWSEGVKQMDLVIKDGSGGSGHAHKRPDSEKFFPTKVRITMVQVSAGSKYDPSLVPNLPPAKADAREKTKEASITSAAKPVDAALDDFYRAEEVQSVHLRVSDEDWQRLLAALPKRIYVRASFRWRGISLENVAIRFKGNSSSSPAQQHKRSFLIKFDEYTDHQRFLGLRRASFDNGVQFGSLFSEPIITEILRDRGVKTHRCNYAKLFLNDKYHGVYVNVERIDETFIERHLPDPDGLLFKVDEGGPGANLQFDGDDPAMYERTFEPETKSSKKGRQKLIDFIRLINQSPEQEFAAMLDAKLEVNDFLNTTAVMLLSGAFDQLTGWNPHNYYLYFDGKHGRWSYLPWDLDVGFCEIAFGQIHVLTDWNAAWPSAGQLPNPLLDRIVADPALLKRYRATARTILDKHFEPERLCAILDAKYALVKDDLKTDPFPPRRITSPQDRNYDEIVESMKKFMRQRYTLAHQQLDQPGQRPEMVSRPGGPMPQLAAKMQRVMRGAQEMQKKGEDLRPIQKLMQQVGPLMQQGRIQEAEKLVGEALKLVGDDPGTNQDDSPRDGKKKAQ